MKRIAALLLLALASCGQAYGQGAVLQSGLVTPGHGVQWLTNGIIGDTGQPAGGGGACPTYPCTFSGEVIMAGAGLGLLVNNNETVSGLMSLSTLTVGGASTFTGLLTANGGVSTTALTTAIETVTGVLTTNQDALINTLTVGLGSGSLATNTALGFQTLLGNTSGLRNTGVGYQALATNALGVNNTAIGAYALQVFIGDGTDDYNNTAIGSKALQSLTDGKGNLAVGSFAGQSLVTGNFNTILGHTAMETAGSGALNNIAIGYGALPIVSGQDNIGLGNTIMASLTTGFGNVGLGEVTLNALTTGGNNIAVGPSALAQVTTGNDNVAIGPNAGAVMGNGTGNVIIGGDSGTEIHNLSNRVIIADGDGNLRMLIDNSGNQAISGSSITLGATGNKFIVTNGAATAGTAIAITQSGTGGITVAPNTTFTGALLSVGAAAAGSPTHLVTQQTTAPALTSCGGGSPALTGTDTAGIITMGTSATGCVLTFNVSYNNPPYCVVTWIATPLASQSYVTAAGSITLTQTSTSGNKVQYICIGQAGG